MRFVHRSEYVGLRLAAPRAAERMTGTTYLLKTLLLKHPARFAGIPATSACRPGCTLHQPKLSTENADNYISYPSPTLVPILDSVPKPCRTANKTRTRLWLKVRFRPWIQPLDPTSLLNRSASVWYSKVFLGRSFNLRTTSLS